MWKSRLPWRRARINGIRDIGMVGHDVQTGFERFWRRKSKKPEMNPCRFWYTQRVLMDTRHGKCTNSLRADDHRNFDHMKICTKQNIK